MRKLVAGKAHPSVHLLRALANTLKGDRNQWAERIEADRQHKRHKHLPKFLGQSADLEMLEPFFPRLNQQNKEFVLHTIKTLLKQQDQQKAEKSLSR
jgi:hypothetical protein